MLLVNAVCSIKNVKETSRGTTKYAYLKSSDIRGLISDSIVITLIYGFFLWEVGEGEGYFDVLQKNCVLLFL